jgi:predicted Zn-dependent protease
MFLGFNYLFIGKKSDAKKLLTPLKGYTFDYAVSQETIPEDYLNGRVDAEGIKAVFMHVDETRLSILEKQERLEKVLSRYPRFRAGLLQLAVTWLQLGRSQEAKAILEKYHAIDPSNSVVEYYLSILCFQRFDYRQAWKYLQSTETLLNARAHKSQALRGIRTALRRVSPES